MHRGGPAVAGIALCLGALTACNGSSGTSGGGEAAPPPTAGATSPGELKSPASANGRAAPLDGRTIVIDPGHNGGNGSHPSEINKQVKIGNGSKACDTTGTETRSGYAEHAFTWDVSNRLAKILRARGAKVALTREDDKSVGPCVTERAALGNKLKADAALSIHADGASSSGHGFHIIEPISIGRNAEMVSGSAKLGTALRDAYHDGTGVPYSNYLGKKAIDRRDDLGGLNMSKVPKVFIECGNMQNKGDAAKLSSASFRQRIADSLAEGFQKYLS
ncbi:N-acetylmuramoyl-L-alanine amidase [Actinomadura darangshiensis]|uniref:N-acetylmuramoyl-L-alanine amidase n=1 Tax=Actinomadura darangshiensis TaxID=705336 RepID=A0A4R4ZLL9_9ACTN|nr:N-acetylmuramoyl-L-alanine amidase [Actinomadura darangshiensis]TDD58996.1 N-acetylmuramoyl-L-alanine amidase [Actinomadura darangshiensis]